MSLNAPVRRRRAIPSYTLAILLTLGYTLMGSVTQPAARAAAAFNVSRAGVDYVDPAPGLTGCPEWTWLQPSCYTNSSLTPSHLSPQQVFTSDLSFIKAQRLGSFERVWISLDQLMNWNSATGYAGYNAQALANVDDMLHRAAAAGVKLDLVLLTWVQASYPNQFHPEAIDGNHAAMRANYLQAVHDFVAHLAADPVDASAIAVMDLQAEGYYQMEMYLYTPSHLGRWDYSMPSWPQNEQCYALGNTLCTGGSAGHGCLSGSGLVDTTCIDVNIIEPWFKDLYSTARAAGPSFNYTISDTGRLLTTSTGAYTSQQWWVSMYPVDVYDIHLYSDAPSSLAARVATGRTLPRPWFAGEVGCTVSNLNCTYSGTAALPVDQWWLSNLAAYGARAVLVEDRRTAWTYSYTTSGEVDSLSPVGQAIATLDAAQSQPGTAFFSTGFDQQGTGALQANNTNTGFTGVASASRLSVENSTASSGPNALGISLAGGGTADAFKQYSAGQATHDLSFALQIGADLALPSSSYIVLARTQPTASSTLGRVDLVMNPAGILFLNYTTALGGHHFLWTSGAALTRGAWHRVELQETAGSSGSLRVYLDGAQIGQVSGLNMGSSGVSYLALGDVSTPASSGVAGHIYIDNVTVTT